MSNIGEKALNSLKQMEYFVNETMGIKEFKQSGWHIEGSDDYEIVKDALQKLNSIENADNVDYNKALECLDKLFNEYKELCVDSGSNEHIYQECNLTSPYNIVKQTLLLAQNPKKYLKWEDLKFVYGEWNKLEVYLGNEKLGISYKSDFDFFVNSYEVVKIYNLKTKSRICKIYDRDKQFFDNLHLESVNI